MSSLIPTPIVDRNGKQTTVHKKPESSSKGSESLRGIAPQVFIQKAHSASLLPDLPHLSADEAKEFGASRKLVGVSRISFENITPTSQSLIKHYFDEGIIGGKMAGFITGMVRTELHNHIGNPEISERHCKHLLIVIPRLMEDHRFAESDIIEDFNDVEYRGHFYKNLKSVIDGYPKAHIEGREEDFWEISTEEEADRVAGRAAFICQVMKDSPDPWKDRTKNKFVKSTNYVANGMHKETRQLRINGKEFNVYLYQHPEAGRKLAQIMAQKDIEPMDHIKGNPAEEIIRAYEEINGNLSILGGHL